MSLCGCGCGGEASPGKRFIKGHSRRGKKPWNYGKTKENDDRVNKYGESVSKTKKEFFQTEEGQQWLDNNLRGENNHRYGKHHTDEAKEKLRKVHLGKKASESTKQKMHMSQLGEKNHMYGKHHTDEAKQKNREAHLGKHPTEETIKKIRISQSGENSHMYGKHLAESTKQKISKARSGVPLSESQKDNISKGLIEFYSSDEGEKLKKEFSERFSGEGGSFFGHKHTEEAKEKNRKAQLGKKHSEETKQKMRKIHSTVEGRQKNREARMGQKIPKHHTKPELRCEELSIKNGIPVTYTGDSSFWIPKKNNGNKVCNPDFILYANGKKFVIEILGDYWHSPLLNYNILDTHYEDKKRHYRGYKWIPVFIWELDIMKSDGEKFFLSELKKAGAI